VKVSLAKVHCEKKDDLHIGVILRICLAASMPLGTGIITSAMMM
jgi:hypothetical protein